MPADDTATPDTTDAAGDSEADATPEPDATVDAVEDSPEPDTPAPDVEVDADEDSNPDVEEDPASDAGEDVIPDAEPDTAPDTGIPNDCPSLIAAFEAELRSVQSCEAAEECGMPITGTSCGCTRNLVARIDADLTHYRALEAAIFELSCEWGFISPCDCPEADGYLCTAGVCGWNYL